MSTIQFQKGDLKATQENTTDSRLGLSLILVTFQGNNNFKQCTTTISESSMLRMQKTMRKRLVKNADLREEPGVREYSQDRGLGLRSKHKQSSVKQTREQSLQPRFNE